MVAVIPKGRVVSYGMLGRLMETRVSGLIVGNWMKQLKQDVPWWRVIGASGKLLIGKYDPALEITQRQKLEYEGVEFNEDVVPNRYFLPVDEFLAIIERAS